MFKLKEPISIFLKKHVHTLNYLRVRMKESLIVNAY